MWSLLASMPFLLWGTLCMSNAAANPKLMVPAILSYGIAFVLSICASLEFTGLLAKRVEILIQKD